MKSPYVSELQPNQLVTGTFLVSLKDVRQKRTGEPYLSLMLCDRTGEVEARMWDNVADILETFDRDDYLRIKGMAQVHQNRLQLTLHKLSKVDGREVDTTDFYPVAARSGDDMLAELRGIVVGMQNSHLQQLLTLVLNDPEIADRLKLAPAAKTIHHAYLGGLLEHILSLCQLSRMMASHYRDIDQDLMLAGAILHDIGKTRELTYDRSFSYSTEGQLLGHIHIGLMMAAGKMALIPDFPPKLALLLEHMILSHHGELAYGSPKVPMFPEALLLHHLDNLDSKMEAMRVHAERDKQVEGCFTGYNAALERSVLKKQRFLAVPEDSAEDKPVALPAVERTAPKSSLSGSPFADKLTLALKKP